jgi:hypothetical protein
MPQQSTHSAGELMPNAGDNDDFKGNGAPGTIRTSDPQIRSLMLYPAELRVRWSGADRSDQTFGQALFALFCRAARLEMSNRNLVRRRSFDGQERMLK